MTTLDAHKTFSPLTASISIRSRSPYSMARRMVRFLVHLVTEYGILVVVLGFGLYVWLVVFNAALVDYLDANLWRFRAVWLGNGDFTVFGYTVSYHLEGYSDYSFFYVHWGNNLLNGVMPYSDSFGHIYLDGLTNNNGLYIFPPLYAYLYGIGIALGLDGYWGIGAILAAFGYLTALPTYGLARHLSGSRHAGEAAALTYLLNPNVLYHVDFVWLNTSPFIFFFFLGFYLLVRGHRHAGTLSIVTAALFKQMAWFLGIPLVIYLLIRPRRCPHDETDADGAGPADDEGADVTIPEPQGDGEESSQEGTLVRLFHVLNRVFDLKGFITSALLVVAYVIAVMLPFLVMYPSLTLRNISLAAGGFALDSYTDPPPYGSPMRLQVLPVVAGLPALAEFLDGLIYSKYPLIFGVCLLAGLMLVQRRDEDRPVYYARRLLFLALILMLWVHLAGPRGVYKYYFTLFAPFFSIFSSSKMVTSREEHVGFSLSMVWLPFALSALILLPPREVYLAGVLLIFVGYLAADTVGSLWFIVTSPLRWLSRLLHPYAQRLKGVVAARARRAMLSHPNSDTENREG